MADKITTELERYIDKNDKGKSTKETVIPIRPIHAVVAFVDLLGTSALMESMRSKESAQAVYEKIKGISDTFQQLRKNWFKDTVSLAMEISDSYVIATAKEDIEKLVKMLSLFQYEILVKYGESMRGGISYDEIIDGIDLDEPRIIGPAFIKARKLEMGVAVYPRIVVSEDLISSCPSESIVVDEDGVFYLNSFVNASVVRGKIEVERLIKTIDEKIAGFDGTKPEEAKNKAKIGWLKTFAQKSVIGGQNE